MLVFKNVYFIASSSIAYICCCPRNFSSIWGLKHFLYPIYYLTVHIPKYKYVQLYRNECKIIYSLVL